MEPPGISSRRLHHHTRRSEHRDRRRGHRVAHTTQTRGSDNNESLMPWPTRDEYARDDDKHGLVNTWLEDIDTPQLRPLHNNEFRSKDPSFGIRSRPESTHLLRNPSPSKLFSYDGQDGQVFKVSPRQRLRERKRPRDLVQGSPILDLRDGEYLVQGQPASQTALVAREPLPDRSKERSRAGSQGSVVSAISGPDDRFTKKARHKTRSDRYETTKDRKPRKPRKKKRKSSGDRGKTNETKRGGDFSSAREVMDNFNSKSILSDRITMQPTVRPGLFDNGRTSKDQLPDLTFHEMHFLKRPAPQMPIPHDRDKAKKRGERELEEVSAFFLHKSMTEAPGASGRNHPCVSASSSPERAERSSSAFSIDVPPQQSKAGGQYGHGSPGIDKDSSRATDWTWSSSYAAPRQRITRTTDATGHGPAQNSTPLSRRNAIQRKENSESQEVGCVERSRDVSSAEFRSKGNRSTREPLAVASSNIVNRQPNLSRQSVRIIRYHDRGVMATEGTEIAGYRQKVMGARLDAVEKPPVETPAESPACLSVAKCRRVRPEDQRVNLTHEEGALNEATTVQVAGHGHGPDRPRSPKWTMIERLEAAVADVESQELQTDLPRSFAPSPTHQNEQAASARYNNRNPGAQSPFEDVCLEIKPCFFGGRHKDQFEAVHQEKSLCAIDGELRGSQRAHEVDLAPQMAPRQTSVDSRWLGDLDEPARGAGSAHRGPSAAEPMVRYTPDYPSSVQMVSPNRELWPQTVMADSAAAGHGRDLSDQFLRRTQSVLPQATEISPQRSGRQTSLEEYIDQMENEVFCRPQDAADDSSMPGWHSTRDDHGSYREFIPQEHQLNADAYDQDLPGDGHLENESIAGRYYSGLEATHDPDFDQEEQKFMSTFWRPNYY